MYRNCKTYFKIIIIDRQPVILNLETGQSVLTTFHIVIKCYQQVQGCIQTDVLSGNHKTKSAILFRLLTLTIEATKKRNDDCQE